jgi:hypothetical protein
MWFHLMLALPLGTIIYITVFGARWCSSRALHQIKCAIDQRLR